MFLSRSNSEVNNFDSDDYINTNISMSSFPSYLHFNSNENNQNNENNENFPDISSSSSYSSSYNLHYVESSNMIAPITTKIRQSTSLTEKIIIEITKSIKIFKPSQSLYQLTSDSNYNNNNNDIEINKPSVSIDVVISG